MGAGSFTTVTGESGSGKSTLLYLLGLMLRPGEGKVCVNGNCTPMSDSQASRIRAAEIGFVFQDAMLDPARSVRDNVLEGLLYGPDGRRTVPDVRLLDLLEEVHLNGAELLDRKPSEISGGQAQRVAVCRALIRGPSVVLADEPTGNLDARSADLVVQALTRAAERGAAVLVATHDLSIAGQAQYRINLSRG